MKGALITTPYHIRYALMSTEVMRRFKIETNNPYDHSKRSVWDASLRDTPMFADLAQYKSSTEFNPRKRQFIHECKHLTFKNIIQIFRSLELYFIGVPSYISWEYTQKTVACV